VRSPFDRVPEATIIDIIRRGWGIHIEGLRYLPVGAGAYHWLAEARDDHRYFVTCDDLETKPWLGSDCDAVFDGLLAAYATASHLRSAGLAFVVAPIVANSGAAAQRIDRRHSVSVFELIDGEPGEWGQSDDESRAELVTMLARLHQTPADDELITERPFAVPGRESLEEALADVNRPWTGGPLSETARHELATHASVVEALLDEVDAFSAKTAAADVRLVITHGEPHPGNLIRTGNGLAMVDWDTVALAPPERDLWMLADDETLLDHYEDLTGATIDRQALAAHRLMWALTDVAAYTADLRGDHQPGADADRALAAVRSILGGGEPSPYGTNRQ